MKVDIILKPEDGSVLKAARRIFERLFEEGVIDYLLVPQRMAKGKTLVQTLLRRGENLEDVNPFSPVMASNSGSIVAQLSRTKENEKVAVVLKPCEIRALIELTKLGQAKMENLFIIGTDCAGTFEVEDYARFIGDADWEAAEKEEKLLGDIYSRKFDAPAPPMEFRSSCRICDAFTPNTGDAALKLLGMKEGLLLTVDSELAERLGLETVETPYGHKSAVEDLVNERAYKRESVFDEFKEKAQSIGDLTDLFALCTRCYACQSACPICYCRVCFFKTETFEPEPERYLRWAKKEGTVRMPTEILLYHLTRANHMAASCVGCGMCESSCPRGIPLSTIFMAIGNEIQKKLDYKPGQSLDDELPIATFKNEEA